MARMIRDYSGTISILGLKALLEPCRVMQGPVELCRGLVEQYESHVGALQGPVGALRALAFNGNNPGAKNKRCAHKSTAFCSWRPPVISAALRTPSSTAISPSIGSRAGMPSGRGVRRLGAELPPCLLSVVAGGLSPAPVHSLPAGASAAAGAGAAATHGAGPAKACAIPSCLETWPARLACPPPA